MYDVMTIGSATVDAFVDTGSKLFQDVKGGYVKVPFGDKILVKHIYFSTGGGATNTAVTFARFGLKTAFLGRVGLGANGDRVLRDLKKEGIDTSLVCREKGNRTGYSVILDAKAHDRTILAFKGSNDHFCTADVPSRKINTRWLYCSALVGDAYMALEKGVMAAKRSGGKVMFNPSSYLVKKGRKFLDKVLQNTDILVFNKEEAELLVGKGKIEHALIRCARCGPSMVIITDGSKGVHVYDGTSIYIVKTHGVKPIETTGAGDSFGSAFLATYIKKDDIEFALQAGVANAESVISFPGAKQGILTWREMEKRVKKDPATITKVS